MATTAFGPQGPNYSTTRPANVADVSSGVDTWFVDCSGVGVFDGTLFYADFFNVIIGNLREAVRGAGITLSNADDTMLFDAITAIANTAAASAVGTIPVAATEAEVAAGVVTDKYISPATLPVIRIDTTLNVPADYATIGAALDYLSNFRIPANVTVTVQLAAGDHVGPVDNHGHPDSSQIVLAGAAMLGSMPVDSDFVMSVAGTGAQTSGGATTDRATTQTMLRSRFASVVTFFGGAGFDFYGGNGIGKLKNLMILGGGVVTTQGINVSYGSFVSFENVSIHDCNVGITMIRGGQVEVVAGGLSISGCRSAGANIYSQSSFGAAGVVIFGNAGKGLLISNAGFANIIGGAVRGNVGTGIDASGGGMVAADSAAIQRNGSRGVSAIENATITLVGGGSRYNTSDDHYVASRGYIKALTPLYGTSTYNPAVNTVGNGFGVIEQ